ncbi:MAG: HNH endonuclease signature motif containing protein [Acidimicrobiales bacterium]
MKDRADELFAGARRAGAREPSQAYLADALVELVTSPRGDGPHRPRALVHLRVDLEALRRGNTSSGELCEIAGVGPVSVATARELLGDSIAKLLVTSATDVHAICNLGRSVPARLYSALLERDRCCVVPGCSATCNLEIDQRVVPFAQSGPTQLSNLARMCHHHHFLKTYEGYCLQGEPGAWVWVHPDGSRHGPGALPPRDAVAPPGTDPPPGGRLVTGAGVAPWRELPSAPGRPAELARSPRPEQSSLFSGDGQSVGEISGTPAGHAA